MFIVNCLGGLGNQMFQYSLCRYINIVLHKEVGLITDFYDYSKIHNGYELNRVFNINISEKVRFELRDILGNILSTPHSRAILNKAPNSIQPNKFISDKYYLDQYKFLKKIESLDSGYIHGYWQNYFFPLSIKSYLLSDFQFNIHDDILVSNLVDRIVTSNSVSVHVRRGDYLANSKSFKFHGVCSENYYLSAISYLETKTSKKLKLFIFSDDPLWCRDYFSAKPFDFEIIDFNSGIKSYLDMYLMSLCKHNIIANSTFSWWSAFLNINSDNIVIAPQNWFATSRQDFFLIPPNWIKI